MQTQTQSIKEAKRAYIIDLDLKTSPVSRHYSIYLDDGEGLKVLWHYPETKEDLLPFQKIQPEKDTRYPYCHFTLKQWGIVSLASMLRKYNGDIVVYELKGDQPELLS